MTERYTQFYTEEFTEVRAIQDTLLLPEGQEAGTDSGTNKTKRRPKPSRRGVGGSRRAVKLTGAAGNHKRHRV